MKGITKRELQITDEGRILGILDTAKVLHLGMSVDNEPYVVPMNYGYVMENGKLVLYLHSAVRGKKLDMIRQNPKVFFALDCDRIPFEGDKPCQYGISYASVMGPYFVETIMSGFAISKIHWGAFGNLVNISPIPSESTVPP